MEVNPMIKKIINKVINNKLDSDKTTTYLGFLAAGNVDWVKLGEGDVQQGSLLAGSILYATFSWFTNKGKK
jgi:hypothetical protein